VTTVVDNPPLPLSAARIAAPSSEKHARKMRFRIPKLSINRYWVNCVSADEPRAAIDWLPSTPPRWVNPRRARAAAQPFGHYGPRYGTPYIGPVLEEAKRSISWHGEGGHGRTPS
jgi:hypothetical protein